MRPFVQRAVERRTYGIGVLPLVALLMTLWDPNWLEDIAFQLSAAARLGLVLYAEPMTAAFQRLVGRFTTPCRARSDAALVSNGFLVALAAQLTTCCTSNGR